MNRVGEIAAIACLIGFAIGNVAGYSAMNAKYHGDPVPATPFVVALAMCVALIWLL